MDKTTNKILTTRFFESWWRRVQAWFVMTLATKKDLESINIDTTELAKQGDNADATLTYISEQVGDVSSLFDEINGENIPVDFVSDYAKQGDNPNATMTELLDAINAISPDVIKGKERLATAITNKGVQTSADTPLADMAENVAAISQVIREIDGGEMYPHQIVGGADPETSPLWNLYEVLMQLKNTYLVSSCGNYKGILLGRFYKGYESIELSLADAYVTSDGSFYSSGATHIWSTESDDKLDRWVAYLFTSDNAEFIIHTQSLCPRDIYIGGSIGSITFYTNGRLGSIVCGLEDGDKLGSLNIGTYTNPWSKDVVIRGLENQPMDMNFGSNAETVTLGGKRIEGHDIAYPFLGRSSTNVIAFYAPELETIYDSRYNEMSQAFRYTSPVVIRFPKLTSAMSSSGDAFCLVWNDTNTPNLIDLEVGNMETSINAKGWNPTNVLASENLKKTLINNIKNHILANVRDRTGLSSLTFTVTANMYNNIASEQIEWNGEAMSLADAFLTKNWLLAGA